MAKGTFLGLRQLRWVHCRLALPGPQPRLGLLSPCRDQAALPCLLHPRRPQALLSFPVEPLPCRPSRLCPSTAGGMLLCIMAGNSTVDLIRAASFPRARLPTGLLPAPVSVIQPPCAVKRTLPSGMHGRGRCYVLAAPGICWALCMRDIPVSATKGV
jgi:hypothetical protein